MAGSSHGPTDGVAPIIHLLLMLRRARLMQEVVVAIVINELSTTNFYFSSRKRFTGRMEDATDEPGVGWSFRLEPLGRWTGLPHIWLCRRPELMGC